MEGEYEEEVDEEIPIGDTEDATTSYTAQTTDSTPQETPTTAPIVANVSEVTNEVPQPIESPQEIKQEPPLPQVEPQAETQARPLSQVDPQSTAHQSTTGLPLPEPSKVSGLLPLPLPQQTPAAATKRTGPVYDKDRQEKVDAAEARLHPDIYDTDAWVIILTEAQTQPIEKVRDIYERFLQVFPTAGRYWKNYAEQEMTARNFDNVEQIFGRCLTKVLNIDLWVRYINYVRIVKGEQGEARKGIKQVFEFALEHMGMDISSTQIWQDYLTFLKAEKATTHYEEGQKMTAIRTLYQRAIANPMHNLETIWKDYDTFENGLDKILAESLLKVHSPKYSAARRIYRERRKLMDGILRNMLARPPRGNPKEEQQAVAWRKLLAFEKSNPQNLDASKLRARVTFTYNQCLLCLYHYPDMWLEAANFQMEMSAVDGAVEVYERAIAALPSCLLLYFAYADFLELNDRVPKAKELYERLMATTADPLACIQYMRFARRTDEDRTAPRKIFAKVKATCTYHVYIALANIEFKVNKNKDAARLVFEAGFPRFSNEPAFVQHYIDFMIQVSDDNNTRAFLEKVLCTIPSDKAQDVWNSFLSFEYTSAPDINTILKLEKRKVAAYPGADPTGVFALVNRYKFLGMWPCSPVELEAFAYAFSTYGKEEGETSSYGDMDKIESQGQSKFPRPDVSCMIVYNPDMGSQHLPPTNPSLDLPGPVNYGMPTPYGFGVGPGGNMNLPQSPPIFPPQHNVTLPEFLAKFIALLPSPNAYQGPIVDVDEVLSLLREVPLPPQHEILSREPPPSQQPSQVPRSTSPPPFSAGKGGKQGKRKHESDSDEETDPNKGANRPPQHDIYRNRQAAKLSSRLR